MTLGVFLAYEFVNKSFCLSQDIVTENEFEKRLLADVIPPSDIGVTFDDIGALENVKDTLKELVMLPLQRPELFCKGQLTKVFIFSSCLFTWLSISETIFSCLVVFELVFKDLSVSTDSLARFYPLFLSICCYV